MHFHDSGGDDFLISDVLILRLINLLIGLRGSWPRLTGKGRGLENDAASTDKK